MSSLILAWKRPEKGTHNVEREYRHLSFFLLPFLGSNFLTQPPREFFCRKDDSCYGKMPMAKTLEGRALFCPLSVAAVSNPHCLFYFNFYIFIPVGPECGWHHGSASQSMVWRFQWRFHLKYM